MDRSLRHPTMYLFMPPRIAGTSMPEYMQENLETKYLGEEISPRRRAWKKNFPVRRFGLWISFYPFDQDEYLAIVRYWVAKLSGFKELRDEVRQEALQWALLRGSRSGRIAWQFARDWAGPPGNAGWP